MDVIKAIGLFTLFHLTSAEGEGFVGHVSGHPGFTSNDVEIKCLENSMEMYIAKEKLSRVKSEKNLILLDPACTASDNGTHYIANPWLKDCGTIKRYQYDGIVYSNILTTKYPKPNELIKKCPLIKVKFACFYPFRFAAAYIKPKPQDVTVECEHIYATGPVLKDGIIALSQARARLRMRQRTVQCPMIVGLGLQETPSFAIKGKTRIVGFLSKRKTVVCKDLESTGKYRLEMKVFSDKRFSKPIKGELRSETDFVDIYYEIGLDVDDDNLEIMPSTCYATPDQNPVNKIKYYFLKDGCILDETVQMHGSGPTKSRFSIQSFKFAGKATTSFFVHCQVNVCELNDVESVCRKGCRAEPDRKRRHSSGWNVRVERKLVRAPELTSVCLDGEVEIIMKKSFYPGVLKSAFHLNDRDCIAKDNGTHFLFKNPVGFCGAMRSNGQSRIFYRNMVYLEGNNKYSSFFPIEVSCSFSKAQSEFASAKFTLESPRRFFEIRNEHPYRLQFKILVALDIHMQSARAPVKIITKEKGGILDIVSQVTRGGILLRTKHCALKTSTFSKKIQLIHKGCPVSKNILYYQYSRVSEILRIALDPASIQKGSSGHLTCTIIVCSLKNTECSRTCGLGVPLIGTGVLSRKRRSVDSGDVGLSCGQNSMTVILPKNTLPPIEASKLRLRDASCKAFENKTHFILSTPLGGCGTGIVQDSGGLAYTNEITQDISHMIIVRQKLISIPFRCLYRARTSASSSEFRLKSPQVLLSGSSKGVHEVTVKLFTDSTYTKERDGNLALVNPEEDMYFEVGMTATKAKVAIVLDQCYGKPTGSNNEREKYIFIRDGCGIDDTVRRYSSPSYDKARFSIKPFQFSDRAINSVFVSCKVSTCNPNDPLARCFRQCSR